MIYFNVISSSHVANKNGTNIVNVLFKFAKSHISVSSLTPQKTLNKWFQIDGL